MTLSPEIAIGLVVCLGGTAAMYWSIRRKVRVHTVGRTPLEETDFVALFPGKEIAASIVRNALKDVVPGDIRLVRPSDRIVADLMVGTVDGLDTNQVRGNIERSCQVTISDSDAEQVFTVGELVNVAHKAMSEQSNRRIQTDAHAGSARG